MRLSPCSQAKEEHWPVLYPTSLEKAAVAGWRLRSLPKNIISGMDIDIEQCLYDYLLLAFR